MENNNQTARPRKLQINFPEQAQLFSMIQFWKYRWEIIVCNFKAEWKENPGKVSETAAYHENNRDRKKVDKKNDASK